jgi:hypothetical protein
VRSVTLDLWKPEQLAYMAEHGNMKVSPLSAAEAYL